MFNKVSRQALVTGAREGNTWEYEASPSTTAQQLPVSPSECLIEVDVAGPETFERAGGNNGAHVSIPLDLALKLNSEFRMLLLQTFEPFSPFSSVHPPEPRKFLRPPTELFR